MAHAARIGRACSRVIPALSAGITRVGKVSSGEIIREDPVTRPRERQEAWWSASTPG